MGVEVVGDRVVWQGNHVSGAGASAGIDMALSLTDRVHGRELAESLQLAIEYDPQPPFSSGAPTKADASTLRLALRVLMGDRPVRYFTQVSGHAMGARLRRVRRAVSGRRQESTSGTPQIEHGPAAILVCDGAVATSAGRARLAASEPVLPSRSWVVIDRSGSRRNPGGLDLSSSLTVKPVREGPGYALR
jgi:hypothetical protein